MFQSRPFRSVAPSVISALLAVGCSSGSGPDSGGLETTGSLSVALELGNSEIDEVAWEITGGDMEPMSGTIDTSAEGATASVEVFGLPPTIGDDYTITMAATTTDGETSCEGSADFGINVGQITAVMVFLNCKGPERFGGVRVNGKLNVCAELLKAVVSPLQTSVGNSIELSSEASDAEADPVTYLWTGTGGTIANPAAMNSTYTCGEVGTHSVTISVSDDDFEYCENSWTVAIDCVATECTTGEECDDYNQCTINSCPNGMCTTENAPAREACDQDGGSLCDGEGGCVGCNEDDDCAPTEMCTGNTCVAGPECTEDPNCDDGNQCTSNVCESEMCLPPSNVPAGTTCNQDGGSVCDGEGGCVECVSDEECPSRFICSANNTCMPDDPPPGVTIDLDARVNVSSNPRTVFLDAGTYDVVPVIGKFTAWNSRVGTTNWRHAYRYSSPELGELAFGTPQGSCGGGGSCFTTPEEAFAADATPSTFTLTSGQNVDFYVCDGPGCSGFQGDNEGGVSLLLSPSAP